MCICMYVCMYVCIDISMRMYVCVSYVASSSSFAKNCVGVRLYVRIYVCVVCVCVVCVCMHFRFIARALMRMYVCVYVCVCMHECVF